MPSFADDTHVTSIFSLLSTENCLRLFQLGYKTSIGRAYTVTAVRIITDYHKNEVFFAGECIKPYCVEWADDHFGHHTFPANCGQTVPDTTVVCIDSLWNGNIPSPYPTEQYHC